MKITVTAEDIAKARHGARACPIARAINRAIPEAKAAVCLGWIVITRNGVFLDANTPAEAMEFVHRFDKGEPVEPFEFDVEFEARR